MANSNVLLALFLAISSVAAASQQPEAQSPAGWHAVYITDLGSTTLRQKLGLEVQADPSAALPGDVEFHCTIRSVTEYDGVKLHLSIQQEDGQALYEGALSLDVVEGGVDALLRWPADTALPDGDYEVHVSANRQDGNHLASTRFRLRKFSESQVSRALAQADDAVAGLEKHVAQLGEGEFAPTVLERLAIARETVELANTAWSDSNFPEAHDRAHEAVGAAASIRSGLTFASLVPERLATGESVGVQNVSVSGSVIESGGTPVFLYGVRMSLANAKHVPELAAFGINALVLELSPADVLVDENTTLDLNGAITPILDECDRLNIAVALQLEPEKMAGWVLDKWPGIARAQYGPFYYDVTHPRALKALEVFYRAVGDFAAHESRMLTISVADAPQFRIADEGMRKGFAAYLSTHYSSIVELNLAWRTRFTSFDEVPIRWDWPKPGYQAHLQRYHRDQVSGFVTSWIRNALGPNAFKMPLAITVPGSTFAIGGARDGIDIEMLNGTFAASAGESDQAAPPSSYALPYPDAQMLYALLRSLNPSQPVFDFGAPAGGSVERDAYPLAERARIWESAMAGVDFSAAPLDALFDASEMQPHDTRDLAGFASGGQSLNRLAPMVQRFQQQRAPIAIVWSSSSRMFESGSPYLPSLRRAYEGVASFGLGVRFISERQIAGGGLEDISIVVLPEALALADDAFDALDRFLEDGGRLVSTGSAVPYDGYGSGRPTRLRASPMTKIVRGRENASNFLRAIDAAFEASPLPEFPRAIDERGYPILGVVSQYLDDEDGQYLYLVNLLPETRTVRLPTGPTDGRDLIEGRPVHFPLRLDPLDPMLVKLDIEPSAEDDAAEPGPDGIPTATVEPVSAPEPSR